MDKISGKWIVTHVLTERCNLNCRMCFQSSLRKKQTSELSMAAIESFYRRHRAAIFAVNITGGEPFLRPGCIELLEKLDEMGLIISINTNGTLLTPSIADRLARLTHLRSINISIDGPKEIHEAIRQQKGIFLKTVSNIAQLQEKLGSSNRIQINTMIMPETVPALDEHISYLKSKNLRNFELIFPGSYSREEVNKSAEILGAYGLADVRIDTADDEIFRTLPVESVQEIVAVIKAHPEIKIKVVPQTFLNNVHLFLDDKLDNYRVGCTKIRHKELRISGSGQIIFCDTLRIPLAACADIERLDDVLDSPAYNKLKEAISQGLPCCKRCCKSTGLAAGPQISVGGNLFARCNAIVQV